MTFSPFDDTDLNTNIRINQSVSSGSDYLIVGLSIFQDNTTLGFSYSNPLFSQDYKEWFSPVIILHDEYSDKLSRRI